jgi:acyl-ACP thioesterase
MQVKQDFLVRLEDTGKGFVLSNKGFLIMLTNLACIHGTRIGQGLMDREKCHLSWMVVGWRLVVDHRPLLCETVHGTTWASGYGRLQTTRDFVLHDQQGQAAAKATSSWLVLDEHNTRVLRMTPEIVEPYGLEQDHQTFPGYAFPREAPAFRVENTATVQVVRSMIDCNNHVHNVAYMDIAEEGLPEGVDMMDFSDVTIVYRREIRPRETVRVEYGPTEREGERVILIREAQTDTVHAFLLLK